MGASSSTSSGRKSSWHTRKPRRDSHGRKPAVDWRRQMERGTMHYGRWYEGPNGSDYRPGNTFDRLENVRAPFTEAEWEERKNYRSFDMMKVSYGILALFLAYRVTNEWPVVWCEEKERPVQDN